jgi:hypothetical protein
LPLLPALLLLLAEKNPRHWPAETWSAFLIAAAIAAQPFLAGPALTGQNAGRLVTLGLLPLVFAWVTVSGEDWSGRSAALVVGILFLGSFHHLYTIVGSPGAVGTAALQLAVAAGVFLVNAWDRKLICRPYSQI